MKQLTPICFAIISACSGGGCASTSHPLTTDLVAIDFQSGFKHTPVEVLYAGQQILSSELTTDQRVGLARTIKLQIHGSRRVSLIIIIDHNQYSYELNLDRGHYIGFFRDLDTGKLQLDQRQVPFEYD